jgi:hypothetical protein
MTAALACGLVVLDAITFSDELRFQTVYRLLSVEVGISVLLIVELLFTFVLAHWLGTRCRAGLIWIKKRMALSSDGPRQE